METKIFTTIVLLFCGISQATLVNSKSVVLDNIEYYIQTNKFAYQLGETAEILYTITNLSNQSVTFACSQEPTWYFRFEKDGSVIGQTGLTGLPVMLYLTIPPNESRQFPIEGPYAWHLQDSAGSTLGIGDYGIIGGLYSPYHYPEVSVPIQIVPEPAALSLLALGAIGLRHKNRKVASK
jgi:hypothetical protein